MDPGETFCNVKRINWRFCGLAVNHAKKRQFERCAQRAISDVAVNRTVKHGLAGHGLAMAKKSPGAVVKRNTDVEFDTIHNR